MIRTATICFALLTAFPTVGMAETPDCAVKVRTEPWVGYATIFKGGGPSFTLFSNTKDGASFGIGDKQITLSSVRKFPNGDCCAAIASARIDVDGVTVGSEQKSKQGEGLVWEGSDYRNIIAALRSGKSAVITGTMVGDITFTNQFDLAKFVQVYNADSAALLHLKNQLAAKTCMPVDDD